MDEDPGSTTDEVSRLEGEEERRRLRRAGLVLLVVLALLAAAFGVSRIRIVPGVTGVTRDVAEARLRSARLLAEGHAVFRGDPGQRRKLGVVRQTPAAGTFALGSAVVSYDYIEGSARVRVPDCVGKPVMDAVGYVQSAQLKVAPQDYERDDPHRRRVVSQRPRGGSLLARGATVRVVTAVDPSAPAWIHPEAVRRQGAQPCFACHDPVFCAGCHLKEEVPEAGVP